MKHTASRLVQLIIIFTCLNVYSQEQDGAPEHQQKTQPGQQKNAESQKMQGGKPPVEAISICLNMDAGIECRFQGPQDIENGYCEYTPDEQYFACKPSEPTDNH